LHIGDKFFGEHQGPDHATGRLRIALRIEQIPQALQALTDAKQEVRDADRKLKGLNTPSDQLDIDSAKATMVLAKDKCHNNMATGTWLGDANAATELGK